MSVINDFLYIMKKELSIYFKAFGFDYVFLYSIGEESGCASSFKMILLTESGPAALPVLRALRVDSTSVGKIDTLSM